jgi:hypothetical protein
MRVVPITIRDANKVVGDHHRHNNPTHGGKFAIGAEHEGKLVGAVIIGRPIAQKLDIPMVAEVTRLVVTPNAPRNTCSFLYSAARRVWQAMGGFKLITYTLQKESGESLRGAGWEKIIISKPTPWNTAKRKRKHLPIYDEQKYRWEVQCV